MLLKNISGQGVYLWETLSGSPKTSDAANITGSYTLDGTDHSGFATANPTEIGNGVYWQPLAQAETNGNVIAYRWTSTTGSTLITPVFVLTTGVSLPPVAYAGANGLVTAGTGTGQISLSSGKVTASLAATDVTGNVPADLQTIKTQAVTCSGGVTVPAATLASTTNITAAAGCSLNLTQALSAFGSALTSSTTDTSLTVNEALHCAIASVGGQQTTSSTTYTTKTSAGTTIRAFTLDQNPSPNNRT